MNLGFIPHSYLYKKFIKCLLCVRYYARQERFKDGYSQSLPQGTHCTMMPEEPSPAHVYASAVDFMPALYLPEALYLYSVNIKTVCQGLTLIG